MRYIYIYKLYKQAFGTQYLIVYCTFAYFFSNLQIYRFSHFTDKKIISFYSYNAIRSCGV